MASQTPKKHQARKRFGQNFLHDQGIIRHIVACIRPKPDQNIVEIGPGLGAITEHLLASAGHLDVVELDRDLLPHLRISFASYGNNLRIHEADALQFDFRSLSTDNKLLRIVGNLPYNISTPLIFHLLSYTDLIADMHPLQNQEFLLRAQAFSPIEILRQATSVNASLIALSGPNNPYGKLGVIEPGAVADIVLIDGNPIENIALMTQPATSFSLIMKNGKVVRSQ